jgi:hypothetical protein
MFVQYFKEAMEDTSIREEKRKKRIENLNDMKMYS